MILHNYWRSGTSYRTRIALNLKGLTYEQRAYDLRAGMQKDAAYKTLNPQMMVPTLETDDGALLTQSPAILEWLEERYPEPSLLPKNANERAIVRAMAALIGCDIHPLGNLRVLGQLRTQFGADGAAVKQWTARWIGDGFAALETLIERHGRRFAYGDVPTLIECYLVPQLYSAERFEVDVSPYPRLLAAANAARALPEVEAAHPDRQPDADPQ
ncbi:maleylacetoacetate isomerase [Sphingomonas sp. CGMCC 1.13654]|uniref:Maleylacetoacetate isomerase n=1 Tax=Sphingomonas chungangi TaxID=2683589 RepID=A0A838L6X5_9SPHN|nr:maleylacetoacetate isomerase [Sphingomonas chungangi]MBA2934904.1 maleylacetoacetate isomerase [Sphingomonas chungangi]MVW58215.1 maleylacetoacetate isomerase [Sphingomonas chungangi]